MSYQHHRQQVTNNRRPLVVQDYPARIVRRNNPTTTKSSNAATTSISSTMLQEPLLLPSSSPRGHLELIPVVSTTASSYRPPTEGFAPIFSGVPVRNNDNVTTTDVDPRQYNHHRHPVGTTVLLMVPRDVTMTAPPNVNPAVDLAWPLVSNGCLCVQCVRTQEIGFTEQCGAFEEILGPGLYCLPWPWRTISGRLTLRLQQLDFTVETRTMDSVFVHISLSVLYKVTVLHSYEAYYRLIHPSIQMQTYVLDVVRSEVPTMTLDDLFSSKSRIADAVFARLYREMLQFGYEVSTTLLTNLDPTTVVRNAMNEVMASRRLKEAAPHKSEALKVQTVKRAEAHSEAMHLKGIGLARARRAVAQGMVDDIDQWTSLDVRIAHPPTPSEVMQVLLVSQYMDLLTSLGKRPSSLFVPHDAFSTLNTLEDASFAY